MVDERTNSSFVDPDDARSLREQAEGDEREPIKTGRPLEPGQPDSQAKRPLDPLPLEEDEPPAPRVLSRGAAQHDDAVSPRSTGDAIHSLDVCPNCGANMPGAGTLVCLRCGFDLKTLKVLKPQIIEGERAAKLADDADDLATLAISQPGRGDMWLPAILGGAAALIMLVCFIAGYIGLYHPDEGIGVARRMLGVLKYIASIAVWTCMALGALAIVAAANRERLGEIKLAAVRTAGIVAVMSLVALLSFGAANYTLEIVVELIAMAAVFMSLALVLFDLTVQRAGAVTAVFAGMHVALLLSRVVIAWLYSAP